MTSPADRIARMKERMAEQARAAEQMLAGKPPVTTAELLKATTAAMRAALGPDAPLPRDITAMQRREDIERLSREGVMTVQQIADAVGLSYNHTSFLRGQLGVARPRRKPQ